MEELKKLNIKVGALTRSIYHLADILERSESQERLLAQRRKELMIAKGKRTKLSNKLYKVA